MNTNTNPSAHTVLSSMEYEKIHMHKSLVFFHKYISHKKRKQLKLIIKKKKTKNEKRKRIKAANKRKPPLQRGKHKA